MKNKLRIERSKLQITQADLAAAIGVSRQSIHAIESGKYIPSTLLAIKLARYFVCKVEDLFELEEND
ncbi:MAG: helix-turn-helix transcriptional regulator [Bacteroidales bacterium]|nr:helix-turn-helix transcriptional regulator [Bacteroidales bacterium]